MRRGRRWADDRVHRIACRLRKDWTTGRSRQQETIWEQRERNAELESRLDRIEAELGIDATADQQGAADD